MADCCVNRMVQALLVTVTPSEYGKSVTVSNCHCEQRCLLLNFWFGNCPKCHYIQFVTASDVTVTPGLYLYTQIRAANLGIRDAAGEPGQRVLLQQPRGLRVPHPLRPLQPQLLPVQRPPHALLAALLRGRPSTAQHRGGAGPGEGEASVLHRRSSGE